MSESTIARASELDDTAREYSSDVNTDLEELTMSVARRMSVSQVIAKKSLAWARESIEKLPMRLTLGNMGFLTVALAVSMPRPITYILVYPIFRLVFGTLYPAYASYKAVRTKNVKEYVKWMMYWIVFALFTCAETFTDVFFSFWFPFYYEIKIIIVLWLLSPATKGSSTLYRRFVHPALSRREAEIDDALAQATERGYTAVLHLGTRGVNYATMVLMQTAIKGGGGLVQQLKKSYSLSDLTGEKEDENRNTASMHDETDMEVEPRRREHPGRRGYSPRRTQSSTNRVEMYFSEVDVDVRQPRPRDPIASLNNIRSSDDISSGYSSGEALQSHRVTSQGESLLRTSSVGARTRARPRSSTTKKVPEEEEDDCATELPSLDRIQIPSSLSLLTAQQALELMLVLSQIDPSKNTPEKIDSSTRSVEFTESRTNEAEEVLPELDGSPREMHGKVLGTNIDSTTQDILRVPREDTAEETGNSAQTELIESRSPREKSLSQDEEKTNVDRITDEICQDKLDQLKVLLSDARKAVTNIVSSHEKLCSTNKIEPEAEKSNVDAIDHREGRVDSETGSRDSSLTLWTTPSVSRSNSDSDCRAGRYNKKPAPRVPISRSQEDLDEESASQSALKATLVIKTGTLKTFTNVTQTKNVFVSHPPESSKSRKKKSRRKEGFTKLLTIPKTFFNNAFHKEQREAPGSDRDSEASASRSRSMSVGSVGSNVDTVIAKNQPTDSSPESCTDLPTGSAVDASVALDSNVAEPDKRRAELAEDKGETRPDNELRDSAPKQKAHHEESAMRLDGC